MRLNRIACVAAVGLLLVGCKPTEKNYQAAYEAAQNKKKAEAAADPDMALPATGLKRLDAPRTMDVDGETLNVKHIFIKYAGKEAVPVIERYNVAVAKFKMPTNALALTEDLVAQKYKAFPVEGNDGNFYVIGATFGNLNEVAAFVKEYKKSHKPSQLVGLEGEPLIIEKVTTHLCGGDGV